LAEEAPADKVRSEMTDKRLTRILSSAKSRRGKRGLDYETNATIVTVKYIVTPTSSPL